MRTSQSIKTILASATLMCGLTACSFFGGEEENAEVAASEEAGAADAAAQAPVEGAETGEANAAQNAETPIDNGVTADPASDLGTNSLTADSASNGLPLPAAEAEPIANADPMASDNAAPVAAVPAGTARVYYVSADTAKLYNAANGAGQAVGTLSMGDPVLVTVEGNWANISNRGWVEMSALSMNPVGRRKAARTWN